uniref:Uncharacterized protein n=1 Tax=Steinernema glaseri TaxID=37863 RepID=A0A1I8AHF7_9BILA
MTFAKLLALDKGRTSNIAKGERDDRQDDEYIGACDQEEGLEHLQHVWRSVETEPRSPSRAIASLEHRPPEPDVSCQGKVVAWVILGHFQPSCHEADDGSLCYPKGQDVLGVACYPSTRCPGQGVTKCFYQQEIEDKVLKAIPFVVGVLFLLDEGPVKGNAEELCESTRMSGSKCAPFPSKR